MPGSLNNTFVDFQAFPKFLEVKSSSTFLKRSGGGYRFESHSLAGCCFFGSLPVQVEDNEDEEPKEDGDGEMFSRHGLGRLEGLVLKNQQTSSFVIKLTGGNSNVF